MMHTLWMISRTADEDVFRSPDDDKSSFQQLAVLSSRHLLLSLADSGIHQRTRLVPVWRVLSSLVDTDVLPVGLLRSLGCVPCGTTFYIHDRR